MEPRFLATELRKLLLWLTLECFRRNSFQNRLIWQCNNKSESPFLEILDPPLIIHQPYPQQCWVIVAEQLIQLWILHIRATALCNDPPAYYTNFIASYPVHPIFFNVACKNVGWTGYEGTKIMHGLAHAKCIVPQVRYAQMVGVIVGSSANG